MSASWLQLDAAETKVDKLKKRMAEDHSQALHQHTAQVRPGLDQTTASICSSGGSPNITGTPCPSSKLALHLRTVCVRPSTRSAQHHVVLDWGTLHTRRAQQTAVAADWHTLACMAGDRAAA